MNLKSTPHIILRKRNGLLNIDYTACDIISNQDQAAARSYNTIIGVYARDSSGTKYYLETSGVYSTTTAAKHKPRAARLADYNGFRIIENIKPDVLFNQYFYKKYSIDDIIQEAKERQAILQALRDNDTNARSIKAAKLNGTIHARKNPEPHQFKNGNLKTKYYYIAEFKYCSSIFYEVNIKHERKTIETRKGPAETNEVKINICNVEA